MNVDLVPVKNVKGIYNTYNGLLPARMSKLNPYAKESFDLLNKETGYIFRFSDMYRTPAESIAARGRKGRIVALAGFSGHNYGISFDLDVDHALKMLKQTVTKLNRVRDRTVLLLSLYELFKKYNWKPMSHVYKKIKTGEKSVSEEWHFNYFSDNSKTVLEWVEQYYPVELDNKQLQAALIKLDFNAWPIDGIIGPITKKAIRECKNYYGVSDAQLHRFLFSVI